MKTLSTSEVTEIVAYKLKSKEFDKVASDHLWPIQKRGMDGKRKKKDWPHREFAKGSAVYRAMMDAQVLHLYFDPIYVVYKTITIEEVVDLEKAIQLFTGDQHLDEFENRDWKLTDKLGNEHPFSDEFTCLVKDLKRSRRKIKELLDTGKIDWHKD